LIGITVAKAKTAEVVDRLVVNGSRQAAAIEELSSRRNAVDALCKALVSHPDEETRHLCAELLRDAGRTKSVPALINALRDRSPHVHFDALSALSKILWIDLGWWLDVEAYRNAPALMHRRAQEWWRRNRRHVWW
jgi:HEAT repeat protein